MRDYLTSELGRAYTRLDLPARLWLRRQGVSNQTMEMFPGPVGVAEIELHELDIFSFAEVGAKAFVHPIYSGGIYSRPVDIVAWMPSDPSRWWTNYRSGWALGDNWLFQAEHLNEPAVLYQSPLDWLRAGGDGVVVMDWIMSSPALRSVPYIIADDPVFGREVEQRLAMPVRTCPQIRVKTRRASA